MVDDAATSAVQCYLMDLEHADLSPFEPELRQLADLALGAGARFFRSRNIAPGTLADPESQRAFMRACNQSFDKAQRAIGQVLVNLEEQARALEAEVSQRRRMKADVAGTRVQLHLVQNRQLVLRRLLDTILYHLLTTRPWIARRLIAQREMRRLDPDISRCMLAVAADRNAETRDRFALVADLTTIVDVCDLVEVERTSGDSFELRLIEVKDGSVNAELMHAFKDPDKSHLEEFLRARREAGLRQAMRVLKQEQRLLDVQSLVATDRGRDSMTGRTLHLHTNEIAFEGYQHALEELIDRARGQSWSAVTVDSCVRLVGATDVAVAANGDALQHVLFHTGHPERECQLDDEAREAAELRAVAREPPPVDLTSFSMRARWARPIFMWQVRPDWIMDLIFGRVRLFAQFNAEDFRGLLHARGLQTAWVSRREAGRLGQERLAGRIPGAPEHRNALRVFGRRERVYLSGFFWRVIGDLIRPKELIDVVMSDQEREDETPDEDGPADGNP